jgi:2-polyprenyl-6-methoxyphenol hydroxylase-like FAD-dependent oxidoreductase
MTTKSNQNDFYDIIIMGGGPAGATLGAILARETSLKIAIVEKEKFPREHIGESFSQRVIPVLHRSGVLSKVLASDCYVQKFGGFYAWDGAEPSTTFFDHGAYKQDGVLRWSIHCNRSEFDKILLDHARSCGVHVLEGVEVSGYARKTGISCVTLSNGRELSCRFFAEASGRQTSIITGSRRSHLSEYQNIAIWTHFVDCQSAQTLPYAWNVFRERNLSPIGNFAFQDGWFWYIPVPKIINGVRTRTWSIGMVTDAKLLKQPDKRYTDIELFLRQVHQVPLLKDLLVNAKPINTKLLTATNYSMVSEEFCDYEDQWLLLGDSAYFVDPLFSSGVAFALNHAATAATLIKTTIAPSIPANLKRDLWRDYDQGWHRLGSSFALIIDQWYHAIAESHPDSIYWRQRVTPIHKDLREQMFQAVVDTNVSPDLVHVLTKGTNRLSDLGQDGPLVEALRRKKLDTIDDAVISLHPGIQVRPSLTLGIDRAPQPTASQQKAMLAFWQDPLGSQSPGPFAEPLQCHRFFSAKGDDLCDLEFLDSTNDRKLIECLSSQGLRYRDLVSTYSPVQQALLDRLIHKNIATVQDS